MAKKGDTGRTPDQMRADLLAKYDKQVVRMEDVQRNAIKFLAWQLQALENEAMDGMGYKQLAVSGDIVNKTAKLTAAVNSLTESERRLQATRKQRADELSPEEEIEAVFEFLISRDRATLSAFIRRLRDWYTEQYPRGKVETNIDEPASE